MEQGGQLLHAVEKTYERTQQKKKGEFSAFVEKHRKTLVKPEGGRVTTRELAARMGIEYEQFRKILNKQKPTKKRDFVIALCAVLKVDSEETNTALAHYDMPPLNTEYPRDDELITILEEQLEADLSIQEINRRLVRNKHQPLDLIDRRGLKDENKIMREERRKEHRGGSMQRSHIHVCRNTAEVLSSRSDGVSEREEQSDDI